MNWKILLLILLLTSGAGFYLAREMGVFEKNAPEPRKVEKLMSFNLDAIDRARIGMADTTCELERHFDQWQIVQPFAGEQADTLVVNNLLRTLSAISVIRKIPLDSISLAQVGLDHPVLSFDLHFADGQTAGVSFGALNPTTDNIYVRVVGVDSVVLVGRTLGPSLGVNTQMIRSRQLTNLPVLRVSSLELERGGRTVRLAMDRETGQWWAESAGERRLVNKLGLLPVLERLHRSEVREFVPKEEAAGENTGLERPVRRLVLEDLDGGHSEVCLGRKLESHEYLLWASSSLYPGSLLLVDSLLLGQLDRLLPENLPYTRLARFNLFAADRMLFQYRDREFELKADSDTLWRLVQPREHKARLWQVERLLTQVDTMNALTILPAQTADRGFEAPQLEMSFYHGDSLIGHYLMGDFAGTDVYFRDVLARRDYTVPPRTLERLTFSYDDLADVQVRHVVQ